MHLRHAFKLYLLNDGLSKGSVETYLKKANKFLLWVIGNDLSEINVTYADMMRYINVQQSAGLKAKSIQLELIAISYYYKYLQYQDMIVTNPAANIILQNNRSRQLYTILTEEQLSILYDRFTTMKSYDKPVPPQERNNASRIRNKVMTGLLVFQGLSVSDLEVLKVSDVSLRKGMITLPETNKCASRILSLGAHQILDISEYVHVTRRQMLLLSRKQTELLFFNSGGGNNFRNIVQNLTNKLRQILPALKSLQQIRASVIVHWLGTDNLRKVQYKAGHKYISSTEAYQVYCTQSLNKDIEKYHPLN